jgi:hypothetical protein
MFYFDIDEGSGSDREDVACEMARKDVRTEAMHLLSDIASEIPVTIDRALFAVVRDDAGKKILEAKLSLTARWLDQTDG